MSRSNSTNRKEIGEGAKEGGANFLANREILGSLWICDIELKAPVSTLLSTVPAVHPGGQRIWSRAFTSIHHLAQSQPPGLSEPQAVAPNPNDTHCVHQSLCYSHVYPA